MSYEEKSQGPERTEYGAVEGILDSLVIGAVNRILPHPTDATRNTIIAETGRTTATSISWNKLGTKVPNVQINEMDYNAADDILVIGTLGRGAWSIKGIYSTLSNPSSIQSLTLRFTTPTQETYTQEIPLESIQQLGSKSIAITNAGLLAVFNDKPEGTIFTPSIIATYGNDESGNPITSVTSLASNIPSFVPRPPPIPPITLAANGVTIKYTGTAFTSNPLFIQANPRNTPQTPRQPEWFAVVPSHQNWRITSYATNDVETGISYFTPPDQSNPVPFNNIVTTLLTNMSDLFNNATTFNEDISSWDTSSVTNMGNMFSNATAFDKPLNSWDTALVSSMVAMFYNAEEFNKNIGSWDTSSVTTMEYMFQEAIAFNNGGSPNIGDWDVSSVIDMSFMFQNAQAFNQNISNWVVSAVTENNFYNFSAGSALTHFLLPPAFR